MFKTTAFDKLYIYMKFQSILDTSRKMKQKKNELFTSVTFKITRLQKINSCTLNFLPSTQEINIGENKHMNKQLTLRFFREFKLQKPATHDCNLMEKQYSNKCPLLRWLSLSRHIYTKTT